MTIRQVGTLFRGLTFILGLFFSALVFAHGGGHGGHHGGGGHHHGGGGHHHGGGGWHGGGHHHGGWHGGGWHGNAWRGGGGGFYVGPSFGAYEDCYPVRVCANGRCWVQQRCY